jgi:putative Ca2+/H+ antiporter (TMEM165/GDT1 family)
MRDKAQVATVDAGRDVRYAHRGVAGTTRGMRVVNVPTALIGNARATNIPFLAARIAAAMCSQDLACEGCWRGNSPP